VLTGICKACRANGCALLGGETAEMPGLYPEGEYDLVGTIVGSVDKKKIIDGSDVREGDAIIGIRCTGLQTNGFSLARRIIFDKAGLKIDDRFPGSTRTVADTLLDVHRSFLKPVSAVMDSVRVRGMAHITGGGLIDNVPRSLPEDLSAEFQLAAWTPPAVFRFLQERGGVDAKEMFRVFNMGIGFVLMVRERDAGRSLDALAAARCQASRIGRVVKGRGDVILAGL
jgi:phosphoribosylformylglycinamidine cyclo-ligase